MSVYVCPAAVVAAPCTKVWEVLRNLPSDAGWLGVEMQRADPPGPLQPGQTLLLSRVALGRRWNSRMEIDAMDEEKGVIELRVMLPLGIVNHEHMTCAPVLDGACRVQFG
jgi:hypothetical protein